MTTSTDAAGELFRTRTYKASKALLRRMWSNPEHLTRWWGPEGFSTTTHEMEFATGGLWRFTMRGPDGTEYPSVVRYTLVSPDRIEYVQAAEEIEFRVEVRFEERGDETEMRFRMTFPSPEAKRRLVDEFGAEEGLVSTMARLDAYVAERDPEDLELVIVRNFEATRQAVWNALTDEAQLEQWICPHGTTMERSEREFRPGGRWSTRMSSPGGEAYEAEGEYLDIDPISLLRFSHAWKKEDGSRKPTTIVSMRLIEHLAKTTLVFVQSGFWSEEARAAHLGGWSSGMCALDVLLGSAKAHRSLRLVREFAAPLDLAWRCWTEPDRLAAWFAPRPYDVPTCALDPRPGGALLLVMRSPEGAEFPMYGEFVDVEPQRCLGWVNRVPGPDGETAIQCGTNVRFEAVEGGTRVTVEAYACAMSELGAMMIGGMELGWNMTLDQLVETATAAN